jgi:hypothetical protein
MAGPLPPSMTQPSSAEEEQHRDVTLPAKINSLRINQRPSQPKKCQQIKHPLASAAKFAKEQQAAGSASGGKSDAVSSMNRGPRVPRVGGGGQSV